jgi:hypothetical protein
MIQMEVKMYATNLETNQVHEHQCITKNEEVVKYTSCLLLQPFVEWISNTQDLNLNKVQKPRESEYYAII